MPTDICRSLSNVRVSVGIDASTWPNISLSEDNYIVDREHDDKLGRPSLSNIGNAPFPDMGASTWPNTIIFEDNKIGDRDNHDKFGRPILGNVGDATFTIWSDRSLRVNVKHK